MNVTDCPFTDGAVPVQPAGAMCPLAASAVGRVNVTLSAVVDPLPLLTSVNLAVRFCGFPPDRVIVPELVDMLLAEVAYAGADVATAMTGRDQTPARRT